MKKIKFAWIVELVLFFVGFYIVYQNFLTDSPPVKNAPVSEQSQPEAAKAKAVVLETAVVCIDIDEEKTEPLLAKRAFNKYIDYLYCFTKVSGPRPRALVHNWIYNGQVQAQEKVTINKSTNSAWTRMKMSPDYKGAWRVDVRLESGDLLGTVEFKLK